MDTKFLKKLNLPALTGFVSLLALASLAMAGSLTPGAAPAPTMHTLGEIFDSIASTTYDSSSFSADANGSLIEHLKYIEANLGWASASGNVYSLSTGNYGIGDSTPETKFEVVGAASVSGTLFANGGCVGCGGVTSDSLDFDEFVDSMTLDADTTISNGGNDLTIQRATISEDLGFSGSSSVLRFEGSTADGSETTLGVTDPTDSRNFLLPNIDTTGTDAGLLIARGTQGFLDDQTISTKLLLNNLFSDGTDGETPLLSVAPPSVGAGAGGIIGAGDTFGLAEFIIPSGLTSTTGGEVYGLYVQNMGSATVANESALSIAGHWDNILFIEGSTIDSAETHIRSLNPTADATIFIPRNMSGVFALVSSGSASPTNAGNFELSGFASVSQLYIGGNLFSGRGVTSNSLDFDEFVDAMTLDATTTIASAGFKLGIGTTSPDSLVTINSAVTVQGSVTDASATHQSVLEISKTYTGLAGAVPLFVQAVWDFPSAGNGLAGGEFNAQTLSTNTQNLTGSLTGLISRAEHLGTGTAAFLSGATIAANARSAVAVYKAAGVNASANTVAAGGTVTHGPAFSAHNLAIAGTITNSYGFYMASPSVSGGTIINQAGVAIERLTNATNNTAILIASGANLAIPVGNYAIYSGSSNKSYFGGGASMSGNFDPGADNAYDLGSSANRWRDLYLASNSLHIGETGNEATISFEPSDGSPNLSEFHVGINGVKVLSVGGTAGTTNTVFGFRALENPLDEEGDNTAIGGDAMRFNTNGAVNTAVGYRALRSNTDGDENSAFGGHALRSNTTGDANTAVGNRAMELNTTGSRNVALGRFALGSNDSGSNNLAVGASAGYSALGSGNIFLGAYAGYQETGSNTFWVENESTASSSAFLYGELDNNWLSIGANTSISGTLELTGAGASQNLLKLTDSTTGSTIGLSNNDGDFSVRLPSTSFSNERTALRIASSSGAVLVGAPANPTLVASISSNGAPYYLKGARNSAIQDNYLYVVSTTDDALTIIDVSNPASPSRAGVFRGAGAPNYMDNVTVVAVGGRYAYVSGNGGLNVVDISNPASASLVGRYEIAGGNQLNAIALSGRYLYGTSGILPFVDFAIFDVADPTHPTLVGSLTSSGAPYFISVARSVKVVGQYAYIAASVDNSLVIVDISNPSKPQFKGRIGGAGSPNFMSGAVDVEVSGKYAYVVAFGDSALNVFDISNPVSPVRVGGVTGTGSPNYLAAATDIVLNGRYAIVTAFTDKAITIWDISRPSSPTLVKKLSFAPNSVALASGVTLVDGRYLYVTFSGGTLNIFDLGGLETTNFYAGTSFMGRLTVGDRLSVGNDLTVRGGANISNSLLVNGWFGLNVASLSDTVASTSAQNLFRITHAKGRLSGDLLQIAAAASTTADRFTGNFARFSLAGTDRIILESSGAVLASGAAQFGAAGAPSSVSYSRFGTAATSHAGSIGAADDLLISGDLEINGSVAFDGTVGSHIIPTLTDTYDLGTSALRWRDLYLASGSLHIGTSGDEAVIDYNVNDDYLAFKPDGSTTSVVLTDAGNMGIGTASPGAKLEVSGGAGTGVNITNDDATQYSLAIRNLTYGGAAFGMWQSDAGDGAFDVENDTRMFITTAGNVGVGDIDAGFTADAKLSIFDSAFGARAFIESPLTASLSGSNYTDYTDSSKNYFITANEGSALPYSLTSYAQDDDTTADVFGFAGVAEAIHSSGTKATVQGIDGFAINAGSGGTVASLSGVFAHALANGTTETIMGLRTYVENNSGSPNIFGIRVNRNYSNGSSEVNYGLYVENQEGVADDGTNYNIWSEGPGLNHFGGNSDFSGDLSATDVFVNDQLNVTDQVFFASISATAAGDDYVCRNPSTGEITYGATCTPSSIRFKENVKDLEHGLDWVSQLRPVTFDWKHNGAPSLGLIAEEVDDISPLLALRQNGEIYSVNYQIMTAVLAKAIQEMDLKISELQALQTGAVPEGKSFPERILTVLKDAVLTVRELVAGRVRTEELCIGETCVTEPQLKELLQLNGISGNGSPDEPLEEPTPTPTEEPSIDNEGGEPTPTPEVSPEVSPPGGGETSPELTPEELNGSSDEPLPPDEPPSAPEEAPPAPETAP